MQINAGELAVEKAIPIYKKELRVFNLYYLHVTKLPVGSLHTHTHTERHEKVLCKAMVASGKLVFCRASWRDSKDDQRAPLI